MTLSAKKIKIKKKKTKQSERGKESKQRPPHYPISISTTMTNKREKDKFINIRISFAPFVHFPRFPYCLAISRSGAIHTTLLYSQPFNRTVCVWVCVCIWWCHNKFYMFRVIHYAINIYIRRGFFPNWILTREMMAKKKTKNREMKKTTHMHDSILFLFIFLCSCVCVCTLFFLSPNDFFPRWFLSHIINDMRGCIFLLVSFFFWWYTFAHHPQAYTLKLTVKKTTFSRAQQ